MTQQPGGPLARTTNGPVRGRERRGVHLYAGIPYAAPPVGELRFAAPRPARAWTEPLDCTRFGAASPQPAGDGLTSAPPKVQDEDCLTLNVSTPATDDGKRPVLVWIHGGGFRTGTGAIPWYDGRSFNRQGDIVVVSINYRLGALGFLQLDDEPGSGNNGIRDQIAALEWVRDNIAAFGGDAHQVTIEGESAGGMCVGTLLAAPGAAGLFHRAIPQSGAGHHCITKETAAERSRKFCADLGADPRAATVDDILRAQEATEASSGGRAGSSPTGVDTAGMAFLPVVDGEVLTHAPIDAIRSSASASIDVLIGTNLDECTLWGAPSTDEARLHQELERMTGAADGATVAATYRARLGRDAEPARVRVAANTDMMFRIPAVRLAEAHHGATWMYLFTWASRVPGLGATHALEIPFAFGNLDQPGLDPFLGPGETPTAVERAMHGAWISFIRTGDPGWPPYDAARRSTMVFDDASGPQDDPLPAERELWDGRL